jgi:hypothetical protein
VNNLEAMSQWATFSRLKIPFHLYVPVSYIDVARRLCQDLQLVPPEIWTYQAIGDQYRWTLVQKGVYGEPKGRPAPPAKPAPKVVAKPAAKPAVKAPVKAVAVKPKAAAKPARPAKAKAAPAKPKVTARTAKPAKKAAASSRAKRR